MTDPIRGVLALVVLVLYVAPVSAGGAVPQSAPALGTNDCGAALIEEPYGAEVGGTGECFTIAGDCDRAAVRDLFLPDGWNPVVPIRAVIHVFCDDDGENCAEEPHVIDATMSDVATVYAGGQLAFDYTTIVHHDSRFSGTEPPDVDMRGLYADDPVHQLNVYVVGDWLTLGDSTPPWKTASQGMDGGVLVPGSRVCDGCQLLAHELGHALGLWHTFQGWWWGCEDPTLAECYEYADGSNGDEAGDFCSDTPPHPENELCQDPGGTDCAGTPWGFTDFTNIMGYSGRFQPLDCRDHFTDQQHARMRCWTNAELICWIDTTIGDVDCSGTVTSADVIHLINYWRGTGPPPCPLPNAGDFNCDAVVDLDDANLLIDYIFLGGPRPECCT